MMIFMHPSLSAFLSEICIAHLMGTLFNDEEASSFGAGLQRCAYANRSSGPSVSNAAVQSLAMTHFARMHGNDQKLLDQGRHLYGRAIIQLANEVPKPDMPYDQDVMLAAVALYFYELMINTTELGWVQHAGGLGRLMEIRGPEVHQFQPLHDYFLFCRRVLISQALVRRKRTFLEREEWQTIPWGNHLHTKTAEHFVQDIQSKLPGIAEDLDKLEHNGTESSQNVEDDISETEFRQKVRERIISCFKELIHWRFNWETSNGNVVSETDLPLISPVTTHLQRPTCLKTVFYFENFTLSDEIHAYNTTLMGLLFAVRRFQDDSIITDAFHYFPSHMRPFAQNPLSLPSEELEPLQLIRETMQSVEYCLLPQHPRRVMLRTTVPLRAWFVICSSSFVYILIYIQCTRALLHEGGTI